MRKHDKRLDLGLPNFRRADLLDCFPIGIVFALCQSMSSSLDDTPVYLLLETQKKTPCSSVKSNILLLVECHAS